MAMVAHDIRNPLTAIKLSAYYLRRTRGSSATSDERDSLDAIDNAMRRANSIVEDLYAYSKDIALNLSDITLHQLIQESVKQVQITPSIQLEIEVPNVKIQADVNRLQRVFVNLIKNALEAMPNGGDLKINGRLKDAFVKLFFEDSGAGMDAETLANVWQPFVTTKSKGMGLGLSICKRFIEAHGGTITIHSIPTQGTTIEILLPLEQRRTNGEEGRTNAE